MYANILVPIDGSDTASRGFAEALRLVKAFGSRICVVHVVTEWSSIPPNLPGVDFESLIKDIRRNGRTLLSRARDRASAEHVAADSRLLEAWGGRAGEHIVKFGNEWSPDLIVCGTHGRRGIRRLLMGSDAEYIVRHSPAPGPLVRNRPEHDG